MRLRFTEVRAATRTELLIVAAAVVAACLTVTFPTARVIAKLICDPIAHATSAGAVLFTLLFVAASTLAIRRRPVETDDSARLKLASVLFGALIAGNAANLAAHVGALRSLNLPLGAPIYRWNGADNTYSYLFHSHAGKSALTEMLAPLAAPLGLEVGQGWGNELPAWTAPACGATLLIALLSYLWLLQSLAARFEWNPWIIVLFGLAVLNAAKSIIDGGLLSYRAPPALIVVMVLAFSADLPSLRRRSFAWIGFGAAVLGPYLWFWIRASPADALDPIVAFVEFVALLGIAAICVDEVRTLPRVGGLILLLLIVAAGYARDVTQGTGRLLVPLPSDYRAIVIDLATLQARELVVGGRKPLEVYEQFGDDPLKPRHVLLAGTKTGMISATFPFAVVGGDAGDPSAPRNAPWRLRAAAEQSGRTDLRLLAIDADTVVLRGGFSASDYFARSNYYCLLHGFAAQLRAAGLRTFTMIPLRNRADRDAVMGSVLGNNAKSHDLRTSIGSPDNR